MKSDEKKQRALDKQTGGTHYKGLAIQPIEYAFKNHLDPCQFSVVKYITRFRDKNGLEDLKKAKDFIDMLIEMEYYLMEVIGRSEELKRFIILRN